MASKERWASRIGLVLAMAGNAVGLGNFLRFPAQAAKNGGGAFLIPYLVALLVVGLPLIWVEWTMGRYGGKYGHHSSPGIFHTMGRSPIWKYLGVFGLWVNLIIAAFYLYIESWTMAYAGHSLLGGFGKPGSTGEAYFNWLTGEKPHEVFAISIPGLIIFFICIALNVFILSRGLAKGIELVSKIGMPLLIVFALFLAIRGLFIVPGTEAEAAQSIFVDAHAKASPFQGLNFMWSPRYDSLANPAVWLAAAGQIFFTLSIGMGSIHCYASYLRESDDVTLTGATAAWTNEFCEVILGGTILLPIAVAYLGLDVVQERTAGGSGFGLGFMVFPTLFQNWGWLAPAAGFLWFGLLFFAAITSSLAMGQPVMAFFQTEFNFSREKSALAFGGLLLPLGLFVACLTSKSFFEEFDYWGGTFALVVFAVIESILFAWVFGMDRGWEEMMKGAELKVPRAFYYVMKYVTPTFLLVILLAYTFQPKVGWDGYVQAMAQGKPLPSWEWSGDGMIGKLLLRDVTDAEQAEIAKIQADNNPGSAEQSTKVTTYYSNLRLWRNIDRLVMVGMFAFFAVLVSIAWKRRAAEGRA